MPSTYSPLKIELMATGEKNNTWGTITNTNLGTALEEAITGTADVTFASGNVTLTLTDTNATQIARNLRLNLIGTTAGARDLIVPAIEKLYFINNTCADAITVKNVTGTGIAVPAGKSMVVFNNATHVVDGITHLTSLTLASSLPVTSGGTGTTTSTGTGSVVLNNTPTLIAPLLGTPTSGVLTNATGLPIGTGVSGLGTGVATFLATPSSSNLAAAVTDETGSGALVFATSPTLVTPVLGTPASATLTNATGLPIGTGVSGLGTGVATFLGTPSSANLLAAVTDETGTGSLVFANTPTLVTPILGTPTSATLTNATGLPIGTGVSGLGTGVATFLATPSSANLAAAVTDETGSGSLVFGTSPTITSASLVTPALGTPTSGVMTNATGLPLTTGVTGTLPVANGGTGITSFGAGVATFLGTPSSANLAAAVTDETGSGSLVFATSPTLVTPVLGTPSSATLTNATGLPIGTGVSGLGTGVATFLATPSSANLAAAVTDETGSGSLVFATSPTLITPLLGTPTSGVMTNVTGLPLTTGVTGTLPVGNGGTGATTLTTNGVVYGNGTGAVGVTAVGTTGQVLIGNTGAAPSWGAPPAAGVTSISFGSMGFLPNTATGGVISVSGTLAVANGGTGITSFGTGVATFLGTPSSANLAAAVTDETGSGALVFANTPTLVTPILGAASATSLVLAAGLVATPALTFTGDLNTGMWSPAADTIAWSTGGSERMRIISAGNVVVGVSSVARGDLDVTSGADGTSVTKSIHLGYSNADFYGFRVANTNTAGSTYAGTFAIQRGTGAAWSSDLLVNDSGNVGIGKDPTHKLTIATVATIPTRAIDIGGSTTGFSYASYSNTGGSLWWGVEGSSAGQIFSGDLAYASLLGSSNATALQLATNGTARLIVDPNGNVGIGTTVPTSGVKLDVVGALKVGNGVAGPSGQMLINSASGTGATLQLFQDGVESWTVSNPAASSRLAFSASGSERMTVLTGGNVGIGTTSPEDKLHVYDPTGTVGNPTIRLESLVGGYGAGIEAGSIVTGGSYAAMGKAVWDGSAAWSSTASTQDSHFTIHTTLDGNMAEKMRIDASGNVGIGTIAPGSKLHVVGSDTLPAYVATSDVNASYMRFFTGTSTSRGGFGYDTAGAVFLNAALSSANMVILNGGDVGIGTTAPDVFSRGYSGNILGVSSSSGQSAIELNSATGSGVYLDFGVNGARTASIYSDTASFALSTIGAQDLSLQTVGASYMWFATNNAERMRITSGGTLLLGTTTTPTSATTGVLAFGAVGTAPSAVSSGGALYVDSGGILKYRNSTGLYTVTIT